jgi:hypothetical protein
MPIDVIAATKCDSKTYSQDDRNHGRLSIWWIFFRWSTSLSYGQNAALVNGCQEQTGRSYSGRPASRANENSVPIGESGYVSQATRVGDPQKQRLHYHKRQQ